MHKFTIIKFRCGVISGYPNRLTYGPAIYTHQMNCLIHGLEKYEEVETLYFDETTSIPERDKIIQSKLNEATESYDSGTTKYTRNQSTAKHIF